MSSTHSFPIEHFWRPEDGNDFQPAFMRAQAQVGRAGYIKIELGPKNYDCLRQIDVITGLEIEGMAPSKAVSDATSQGSRFQYSTLRFPNLTHGLVLHFSGTYVSESAARGYLIAKNFILHGAGPTTEVGTVQDWLAISGSNTGSCVSYDPFLVGSGVNSDGSDPLHPDTVYFQSAAFLHHGIMAFNRFFLENVTIRQFPGDGLHCDSGVTALSDVNVQYIESCRFYNNGRYGTFWDGGDSNGTIHQGCEWNDNGEGALLALDNLSSSLSLTGSHSVIRPYNQIHQIYDSSFLGNQYLANHVAGNTNSSRKPIRFIGPNNRSIMMACYTEGLGGVYTTDALVQIYGGYAGPASGSVAVQFDNDTTGKLRIQNSLQVRNVFSSGAINADGGESDTSSVYVVQLGDTSLGNKIMAISRGDDSTQLSLYNNQFTDGWWEWAQGTASTLRVMAMSSRQNVREGQGQLWFPRGFFISDYSASRGRQLAELLGVTQVKLEGIGTQVNISSASFSSTGSYTIHTSTAHGFTMGQRVLVENCEALTSTGPTDGYYLIHRVPTTTTLILSGTTGSGGTYSGSSGIVTQLTATGRRTAPPSSGLFAIGDIIWNSAPVASGSPGWICLATGTAGSPAGGNGGTWGSMPTLI